MLSRKPRRSVACEAADGLTPEAVGDSSGLRVQPMRARRRARVKSRTDRPLKWRAGLTKSTFVDSTAEPAKAGFVRTACHFNGGGRAARLSCVESGMSRD